MALSDRIIGTESGGNPYAKNPRSSAYGPGQFIDSTWLGLMKRYRPDLTTGKSDSEILSLRSDPALAKSMVDAYASDNSKVLESAGLPVTAGTTYLSHFAGPNGAISVLQADPSTPVSSILGEGTIKANPFLAGMTAGDLKSWADRKMGSTSMPATFNQVPMGILDSLGGQGGMGGLGGFMGQSNQNGLLGFAAPALGGLMQSQSNDGGQQADMPPPSLPPPPIIPRRRIDLSQLQAMISQPRPGGVFSWS